MKDNTLKMLAPGVEVLAAPIINRHFKQMKQEIACEVGRQMANCDYPIEYAFLVQEHFRLNIEFYVGEEK